MHVETGIVAGGGSILHDPDQGIYFGTLDLAFRGGLTMQAICLIGTKLPDGTKGFSLVAILTFELGNPFPIGMGFFLEGFGGMFAMNRTFDEVAMRAALPTGQLRNVLFPTDPVHHTTEILRALQTLFPAKEGSYIVGLLVKIGWARPTLVEFELGLLYEWGNQHRLIILGRVSAILPRPDFAILKLQMDAVGILISTQAHLRSTHAVRLQAVQLRHYRRDGCAHGVEGIRRLCTRNRRTASQVRRTSGIPERGTTAARAHERRESKADLPGVLRDHVEHGAVRRERVALRRRIWIQH